jgi:RNA polymerase sigma-70 factor, ECF subfamily
MNSDLPQVDRLIDAARADRAALGALLERYRPFLLLVAQQRIGPKLAVRCDPADAVQSTFVDAQAGFERFAGSTEPEFSAWIKRMHLHNLDDLVREHVLAKNRSVKQERAPIEVEGSASFCWWEPAAEQTSPSQRLIQGEKALRLAELLQSLPDGQREAVRLRHLEGWSLEQIAEELGRSLAATAGLIKRGLAALREKTSVESWF